ncbi:2-dehydro-3-deoxygalactonokinase [Epibacterium ulvae]|uniref:2-dehydro-3-deoxygalactonokinase n=1 Tax=Epibacterium ulvae TaxID=1156985 RepID=UPI001BFCA05F|nr:2-dehydro-3-deoxygalactonokinase [Epibacterium ulvae]MBT8152341.1 2-dehydro-3-deoxygalactonokinase [Epibacterium ulvae]
MTQIEFVAVDWGTSSFRAWAIGADGAVCACHKGAQGMNTLTSDQFSSVLEQALVQMEVPAHVPVVASGMVGAAQGWIEAPYVPIDGALEQLHLRAVKAPGTAREVFILPGVKQTTPPNVMRGEETQIAGFLQSHAEFTGVLCLPGTHAKWVEVSGGRIQHFVSAMTGEIFGLISDQSILRHSMGADGWDQASFETAVVGALATPESVATELFEIRAGTLLTSANAAKARARLSGLLLGFEFAATRTMWSGQTVHLIGAADLTCTYAQALSLADATTDCHDATALTLAGLSASAKHLLKEPA